MLPRIPSLSQVISLYNGDAPGPLRRTTMGDIPSSDEEPGEEDETRAEDVIPDSSTSSRRPPQLTFRDGSEEEELGIRVHPHTGCVALFGTYVVLGHDHSIKIFDLAKSDQPLLKLDTKDIGAKDSKVSCMEFRPTSAEKDRGYLLWVGTREGHIFELDIRTGFVKGFKQSAHHHDIVHIFRHSRSMVTLDESGKALVFSPDVADRDISLTLTTPRVVRTTEKQDFVKMLDGKLWTAIRTDHHSHLTHKSPTIRVFDIFSTANTEISLLPTEHVGPVTSATILPSQPGMVYVGHEEGCISMWELDTEDGYRYVDVMKVSSSDILSLEGVSNRLWAGSRDGTISAYDVSQKLWLVTNCWEAHPDYPVMELMINHYAITKVGKLCVVSIGGDYQLRLWDGLLGWDWVEKELVKSEASFSSFRDLSILMVSWNSGNAGPDSLTGDPQNCDLLEDALRSVNSPPDIIVFGFQEVIDLESRRMMAYNVLLGASGGKKKSDDGLLEKVSGAYKRWKDRLAIAVRTAMPKDVAYCMTHCESLIGLFSCIFVKEKEKPTFDDLSITTIKRGMKGWYGNKGGIVARLVVGDSSICFVNCHLAAGHNKIQHRNADVAAILEQKTVFSPTKDHSLAYIGGNDGTMILDHEFVVLSGDMNYRIGGHHRDAIISSIDAGDLASLLPHDQLLREIKSNLGFRLRGFSEGPITFSPTYKYDLHSKEYDSSEKHRSPAWCDRVLWRSRVANRVQQLHYKRYEADVSDHRPISAAFTFKVKKFDYEGREKLRVALEGQWLEQQEKLLVAAKEFYISQALI